MIKFQNTTSVAGVAASGFVGSNNVAVYWGQNSYGQGSGAFVQQRLATYCADSNMDVIPLAFMVSITSGLGGQPVINFANAGNNCTLFTGTNLLQCPQIGEDIKTCQTQYNKKILLSIGGATYTEGGFASEAAAISAAELVWRTFGDVGDGTGGGDSTSLTSTSTLTTSSSVSLSTTSTSLLTATSSSGTSSTSSSTGFLSSIPGAPPKPSTRTGSTSTSTGSSSSIPGAPPNPSTTTLTTSSTGLLTSISGAAPNPSTTTLTTSSTGLLTSIPGSPPKSTRMFSTTSKSSSRGPLSSIPGSPPKPTRARLALTTPPSEFRNFTRLSFNATTLTRAIRLPLTERTDAEVLPTGVIRRQVQGLRPFGDAVVDGFDLDLESANTNFKPFASRLRALMDASTAKSFYLTAAPQCPYPDVALDSMLNGGVKFDAVFVQFYNNYCGVQSYTANTNAQGNFNFETWDHWASTGSANPNVKVFLGIPAGPTAAGSGYLPAAQLSPIIKYCQTFSSFGGVMMWDTSQAYANPGFLAGVKAALGATATKRRLMRINRRT